MNVNSLLDFEAPNKTDAIIVEARDKIPYNVQRYIRDNLNSEGPKDMLQFIRNAWDNQSLDVRDEKYKRGKAFYIRLKNGRGEHNFTDDQIRDIIQKGQTHKPAEILKEIYKEDLDKGTISRQAQSVKYLLDAVGIEYLGPAARFTELQEIDVGGEYRPAVNDDTIIRKVNKAIPGLEISKWKLTSFQKKCIRVLKANMAGDKFCLTVNSFRVPIERQIFENEFIRSCFDRPDMIASDINTCMMLAGEYVREVQIREMMNLFDARTKSALEGDDKQGLSQSFAENLKAKTMELDKCQKNIKDLNKIIDGSYAKRKEVESKFHESIAKYVNAVCEESNRTALINQKKAYETNILKPEIDKIARTEQTIGEVHGIGIDEILGFAHQIND